MNAEKPNAKGQWILFEEPSPVPQAGEREHPTPPRGSLLTGRHLAVLE